MKTKPLPLEGALFYAAMTSSVYQNEFKVLLDSFPIWDVLHSDFATQNQTT
jgi:hypothetical protein